MTFDVAMLWMSRGLKVRRKGKSWFLYMWGNEIYVRCGDTFGPWFGNDDDFEANDWEACD